MNTPYEIDQMVIVKATGRKGKIVMRGVDKPPSKELLDSGFMLPRIKDEASGCMWPNNCYVVRFEEWDNKVWPTLPAGCCMYYHHELESNK